MLSCGVENLSRRDSDVALEAHEIWRWDPLSANQATPRPVPGLDGKVNLECNRFNRNKKYR